MEMVAVKFIPIDPSSSDTRKLQREIDIMKMIPQAPEVVRTLPRVLAFAWTLGVSLMLCFFYVGDLPRLLRQGRHAGPLLCPRLSTCSLLWPWRGVLLPLCSDMRHAAGGAQLIVMEYCDGGSVMDILRLPHKLTEEVRSTPHINLRPSAVVRALR